MLRRNPVDSGLLFLLPSLAGFIVFFIWPFIISTGYSFLDKPVDARFAGLRNYLELLANPSYRRGLFNTLIFIGISVPLNMFLSLIAALLVRRVGRHKDIFMLIFLIPLVLPSGSMIFFWKNLFGANGYLNGLLAFLSLPEVNWLDSSCARLVVVLIFIWKNLGYNIVLFAAGLSNIPKLYYEAAAMDGAGRLSTFVNITLANLMPSFVLVAIMSIINSFKVFKEIFLLTGSYPHESIYMLQHFMNNMFGSLNYPKLTTATSIIVLMMACISQGLLQYERRAAA